MVAPAPTVVPFDRAELADGDPDVEHWVCCDDENLAVCGTDVTGEAWTELDDSQVCVTCRDLVEAADCNVLCPVAVLHGMRGGS